MGMTGISPANFTRKQVWALKNYIELEDDLANRIKKQEADVAGKTVFDAMMTPLEKYKGELRSLYVLYKLGAINQETLTRAQKSARAEMGKDLTGKVVSPGEFGIVRSSLVSVTGIERGIGVESQILTENKKQTILLTSIDHKESLN